MLKAKRDYPQKTIEVHILTNSSVGRSLITENKNILVTVFAANNDGSFFELTPNVLEAIFTSGVSFNAGIIHSNISIVS